MTLLHCKNSYHFFKVGAFADLFPDNIAAASEGGTMKLARGKDLI